MGKLTMILKVIEEGETEPRIYIRTDEDGEIVTRSNLEGDLATSARCLAFVAMSSARVEGYSKGMADARAKNAASKEDFSTPINSKGKGLC